jgi:hypothetical protein
MSDEDCEASSTEDDLEDDDPCDANECARCGRTLKDGGCDYCCGDPDCEICS